MNYNVLENGWYQLPFTKTDGEYTLTDAIVVPPEEYAAMTEESFSAMTQKRFDDWVAFMKAAAEETV